MPRTSCHCGAVRVEIARRPRRIMQCNCSICRRHGARWAYGSRRTVRVQAAEGALRRYARADSLYFDHCATCGCLVLYEPIHPRGDRDRIGVNLRLIESPDDIAGVTVRHLDGAGRWRAAYSRLDEPQW